MAPKERASGAPRRKEVKGLMGLGSKFENAPAHLLQPTDFLEYLHLRYRLGYDTILHAKGEERGGKSSFAIHLAKTLWPELPACRGFFNDWKDLNRLLIDANTRFEKRERNWPWFWGDEATNILDAADWNRIENKETRKLFRQWGYLRALSILIDPDGRLDKYVMRHRAKIRVILLGRGLASIQLQRRDRNQDNEPWYEERLRWKFPNPETRWPQDYAEYLERKKTALGFRLSEASNVIEAAQNRRLENRLKSMANIQKLEKELDIKPTQDS